MFEIVKSFVYGGCVGAAASILVTLPLLALFGDWLDRVAGDRLVACAYFAAGAALGSGLINVVYSHAF